MTGPLAAFAPGFASELMARGYRPGSTAALLELTADVSAWLAAQGLTAGDLTEARIGLLMSELRAKGRSRLISSRALSPLLEYLRELGVVPPSRPAMAVTATEMMIERYSSYLFVRRGLARSTVRNYLGVAREFFSWRPMKVKGAGQNISGGVIGRVAGVGGLRSPPVSSVRRAGAISARFLPEFGQE
jgi:hypothetical protein